MINRRRFLQAGAATGVILTMPRWAFAQSMPGFAHSVPIKKFAVALPGLILDTLSTGASRGIPVLTAASSTATEAVYKIKAEGFTQKLLDGATLNGGVNPDVKLWGYASTSGVPKYLGGVIVATGGKTPIPVKLEITNLLKPTEQLLPLDISLIDPASRTSTAAAMRQDRIAIHNHGAFVFWDSDGGPFHWFSSATDGFVHGPSFQNGPTGTEPGVGTATYFYPNQQSARFLWYHDHAYGVTRTNAYAGLASAYLITDRLGEVGEQDLIAGEFIPGKGFDPFTPPGELGIPLIIQDKTFWEGPNTGNDRDYPSAVPQGDPTEGDLWYPHTYQGALDPPPVPPGDLPDMALAPTTPGLTARWGASPNGPFPKPASVPEFFSDTIVVNGAPYPFLEVAPQRYRFRLLNASQGRFYNLQLYVADNTTDGITLEADPRGELDPNGNPILVPTNAPGPAFVQIANEGGFLPEPVIFNTGFNPSMNPPSNGNANAGNTNSNRVMRYKAAPPAAASHSRRADAGRTIRISGDRLRVTALPGDPTVDGPGDWNLLMAPAERADVIIDFRQTNGTPYPDGTEFILYNDAPAPFPGGDTRNDYFRVPHPTLVGLPDTWSNDLTSIGGAANDKEGQNPDTRILMKFVVNQSANVAEKLAFAGWVGALETELPKVFVARNEPPLVITSTTKRLVKTLGEDNDEHGRLRQFLGTPSASLRTYLDFPSEVALEDEVQVWEIYNTTADTHPMHFHLVNVQVIDRQQWQFDRNGAPVFPLSPLKVNGVESERIAPDLNERGWRETVRMNPGEITRVAMKFTLPTGMAPPNSNRLLASYGINGAEYVWHCHILEHEEHDMMRPMVVIPKPPATAQATPPKK